MNKHMFDLCSSIIEKALKLGADGCKARLSKQRSVDIKYREGKPEIVKEASTQNLVVNLFVNGKYSSQSTPDIRINALDGFLQQAIQNTQYIEHDPYRYLPPRELVGNFLEKDLKLFDPGVYDYSIEKKHQNAKIVEEICKEKAGEYLVSVETGTSDTEWEEAVVASNGLNGYSKSTDFWIGGSMTVNDEGDRKPTGSFWAGCRYINDIPSLREIGEKITARAIELRGGKKITTGTFTVIVENRVVSSILNGLINALYGSNIQQKRSFLADKKGKPSEANCLRSPMIRLLKKD
ncbi:MAG: hypothetical protein HC906_03230 [Bacteroidales bacterium]|nr:hypothetical protein [Bacteroidales bacterium]